MAEDPRDSLWFWPVGRKVVARAYEPEDDELADEQALRLPLRPKAAPAGEEDVREFSDGRVAWYCIPTVLVILGMAAIAAVHLASSAAVPGHGGPVAFSMVVSALPKDLYCWDRQWGPGSGGVVHEVGSPELPRAPYTLYARVTVPETGSSQECVVASWGASCAELLVTQSGNLEYREGPGVLDRLTVEPALNLADGAWHNLAAARQATGRVALYADGFQVAVGDLASGEPAGEAAWAGTCGRAAAFALSSHAATFRTFSTALTYDQVSAIGDAVCVLSTTTTTSLTTTATATSTTSATATSTTRTTSTTTLTPPTSTTATTTATATRTATKTRSSTTETESSTSTSTTGTTSTTTSTTWTLTLAAVPQPFYSSSGGRSRPGGGGPLSFAGAALPQTDKGLTLVTVLRTREVGSPQDVVSWAAAQDGASDCVELQLTSAGGLEYREHNRGVTSTSEERGVGLADGQWHRVAVSRSAWGIVYLYVDSALVGQALFSQDMPAGLRSEAKSARTCAGREDLVFTGDIAGLRTYDVALSRAQLDLVGSIPLPEAAAEEATTTPAPPGTAMPTPAPPAPGATTTAAAAAPAGGGPTGVKEAVGSSVVVAVAFDHLDGQLLASDRALRGGLAKVVEEALVSRADASPKCSWESESVRCTVTPSGGDAVALQSSLGDPTSLGNGITGFLAQRHNLTPAFAGPPRVSSVTVQTSCCVDTTLASCLACVVGVTVERYCRRAHAGCPLASQRMA